MSDETPSITIGAEGVDTASLVAELRRTVEQKLAAGVYDDARIAMAERHNLQNLSKQQFLDFYLDCLREAVYVDINDFEIVERRKRFGGALRRLKGGIWSLLKFYTYRLWSQQNQVNGLLFATIEAVEERNRERIEALEARIAKLEAARDDG